MDASDLVDFLLKEDDDYSLSIEYEVQRMPWQTTGVSIGNARSRRKTVRNKRCSDLSKAEMDELLKDLEQLIVRPHRVHDVEVTAKDSGCGGDVNKGPHNDQKAAKKGHRKSRKQSSSKKDDAHPDVTQAETVGERKKTNKGKIKPLQKKEQESATVEDKKIRKSRKSKRKPLDFDTRNEEADRSEIKAIIREQQIESTKFRSHEGSQTKTKHDKSLANGDKKHNSFVEEGSPMTEKNMETIEASSSSSFKKKRNKRNKNKGDKSETKVKEKNDSQLKN